MLHLNWHPYNPSTMRRIKQTLSAIGATLLLGGLVLGQAPQVAADTASSPSLVVSQLKITSSNGQFITLYNASNTTLNMSNYQLEYFNNFDLTKATSSRLISLSGSLPAHSYYMVSDDDLLLCYQLTVDSVSLGLSSTAGLIDVLASTQSGPGGSVVPSLQDYVGWSKTATSGAQTLPSNVNASLLRQPVDALHNPAVASPGGGSWQSVQPDASNACNLVTSSGTSQNVATGLSQLLPASEPPATIVSLANDVVTDSGALPATLPASDIGLMAPQVTELLPNPAGTGNDGTDEYIEVYNPNSQVFDLSGFSLQSGLTSLHNYAFPNGTTLPPQGFTAFYSATTGLSLSNTSGQVKLIDPFGNSIAATDPYATAKDGQAWALANGKWYWTTKLTPGGANIIVQPVTTKKAATTKSKATKSAGAVKGAKTSKKGALTSPGGQANTASTSPIHLWTLALVLSAALLYGAYEYRADLANRFYQLRRNFGAGRRDRV